jgi:four helix bundle protein
MKANTSKTGRARLVENYRDLKVYQAAFEFQQALFKVSKAFPKEEMYSLTDQMRRSSRSVGASLAEPWSKRRYQAHFLSKLTDADSELQETLHWLRTALACEYLSKKDSVKLADQAAEIGKMLGSMIANHLQFCIHQPAPHRP